MEEQRQTSKPSNKGIFITIAVIIVICATLGLLYPFIAKPFESHAPPTSHRTPIPDSGTYLKLKIITKNDSHSPPPASLTRNRTKSLRKRLHQLPFPVSINSNNENIELHIGSTDYADIEKVKELIARSEKFSIHFVHRQSRTLAEEVVARTNIIPGFTALPHSSKNLATGEIITEYILIDSRAKITNQDVKAAYRDAHDPTAAKIEFTDAGAEKMLKFTRSLIKGNDVIATVYDGRVINYATLNAESLGKKFIVSGLESEKEAQNLVTSLQRPPTSTLEIIEQRAYSN